MMVIRSGRPQRAARFFHWAGWLTLGAVLTWSYGPVLLTLCNRWYREQDYIYGFLVPPFAGLLLWLRRAMILESPPAKGSLWGLAFFALCGAMRIAAALESSPLVDALSLVPCMAGVVLLAAGWQGLRWAWPAVVFLVFMVPLPEPLAVVLGGPLQDIGTSTSTYLLQTFGIAARGEGNIIVLPNWRLGVEEACSGLRTLMLFLAVCVGAAMVMRRHPVERILMVLSAAPIAIAANVIRITVTGVLSEVASQELAFTVFHDLTGFFMTPLAVVLLWLEMLLFGLLFAPVAPEKWN